MSKNSWLLVAVFLIVTAALVAAMVFIPAFWSFMNNSNFGGAIIGIWLPGGFIYIWTHYLHRQHRNEMRDLHQSIHEKLDSHSERLGKIHLNALKAAHPELHKDHPV